MSEESDVSVCGSKEQTVDEKQWDNLRELITVGASTEEASRFSEAQVSI